jgi:hypothetical protein
MLSEIFKLLVKRANRTGSYCAEIIRSNAIWSNTKDFVDSFRAGGGLKSEGSQIVQVGEPNLFLPIR